MANQTKEQRVRVNKDNAAVSAWLSYYHLIKQDVERLDYRLYKMSVEATTLGSDEESCQVLIAEKLPELIQHVAHQREEREKSKNRSSAES